MQHETVDHEISGLMKDATAETKEGNFIQAIAVVREALSKIKQSNLLYGHGFYTKIIPYYQKAGLYSEVESFCLNELVPDIREAVQRGMGHRCIEIQEIHFYQYIAMVYDKLRLVAKREKEQADEARFFKEYEFYENKWGELQPAAEKIELKKEFEEMIDVFGPYTSVWPDIIQKQFEAML